MTTISLLGLTCLLLTAPLTATQPINEPEPKQMIEAAEAEDTLKKSEISKKHTIFVSSGYSEMNAKEMFWLGG